MQFNLDDRLPEQDIGVLNALQIDDQTGQDLFLLCNEFASRLVVQGQLENAEVLIEQALVLNKEMSIKHQSCLLANICCFYERKGDLKTAQLY